MPNKKPKKKPTHAKHSPMAILSKDTGIPYQTLMWRYYRGWRGEKLISKQTRGKNNGRKVLGKTYSQWCRHVLCRHMVDLDPKRFYGRVKNTQGRHPELTEEQALQRVLARIAKLKY